MLVTEHIPLEFNPMLYSECSFCFNRLQALSVLSNDFLLDSKIVPAYLIDAITSKETFPSVKGICSQSFGFRRFLDGLNTRTLLFVALYFRRHFVAYLINEHHLVTYVHHLVMYLEV